MPLKWANNASTTIAGSITAVQTTVAVAAGTGILFPQVKSGSGDFFCATFYDQATKTVNEIVHVTDVTGDILTIEVPGTPHVRGLPGTDDATTPRAWNAGDILANLITAGTLDAFVQASEVPAAPTTELYVGIDISTTPNHIICPTDPIPASLQPGMQFNIKVANANKTVTDTLNYKAEVDLALNGNPAITAKLTDGSPLNPNDLLPGLEYIFIYNGVNFTTCLQDAVLRPPQKTFYVRSDSTSTWADPPANTIETQDGLQNTPQSAFKTLQGALNTIQKRYIATDGIILKVADGTYPGSFNHGNSYIAAVEIIGNDSYPGNVVLDARGNAGTCIGAGQGGRVNVHGFTFLSFRNNIAAGGSGTIIATNCHYNAPTDGQSPGIATGGGTSMCQMLGPNNTWSGSGAEIAAAEGGAIYFGGGSVAVPTLTLLHVYGQPSFSVAVVYAFYGGIVDLLNYPGMFGVSQDAQITGHEFVATWGGGIGFGVGAGGVFNTSLPGYLGDPSAWIA